MAAKLVVVTDVDEAWRLRQAGLLWFMGQPINNPRRMQMPRARHDEVFWYYRNDYTTLVEDDDEE